MTVGSGTSLNQKPFKRFGGFVWHSSRMCGRLTSRGAMKATFCDVLGLKFSNLANLANIVDFTFTKNPTKQGSWPRSSNLANFF